MKNVRKPILYLQKRSGLVCIARRTFNSYFDTSSFSETAPWISKTRRKQSDLSKKLREIFHVSYDYLKMKRDETPKNVHRQHRVPAEIREFMVLYSSDLDNTFLVDCITNFDSLEMKSYISRKRIEEEDYELSLNYNKIDSYARIEERRQIIKIRKLDRAIGENLKLLYNYRCQICGDNFGYKYGANIVESHHIENFVTSLNNNADNILIVCPNHHRVIHKVMPIFDKESLSFHYPNGFEEKIIVNKHLFT
jgi:5-methylcytosine-specific restriction protein A